MNRAKLSYILMAIGIVVMLSGVGFSAPLLAAVTVGEVTISDIPPTSATAIGVGAIIFLAGLGAFFKGR